MQTLVDEIVPMDPHTLSRTPFLHSYILILRHSGTPFLHSYILLSLDTLGLLFYILTFSYPQTLWDSFLHSYILFSSDSLRLLIYILIFSYTQTFWDSLFTFSHFLILRHSATPYLHSHIFLYADTLRLCFCIFKYSDTLGLLFYTLSFSYPPTLCPDSLFTFLHFLTLIYDSVINSFSSLCA